MSDANLGDEVIGLSEAERCALDDAITSAIYLAAETRKPTGHRIAAAVERIVREHTERAWDEVERLHFDLDREARARQAAEGALAAVQADAFSEDAQAVLFGVTGTHPETYGGVTKDEALECAGEVLTRIRHALATPTTTEESNQAGHHLLAAIAAVLAGHQRRLDGPGSCLCENWPPPDHSVSWPDHLANALTDLIAERDRRTAATAVREAAEQASDPDNAYVQTTNGYVARWLRDRADRIERGE